MPFSVSKNEENIFILSHLFDILNNIICQNEITDARNTVIYSRREQNGKTQSKGS